MKKNTQLKKEKGFVVLFTILISSLVLLMALGISSIATKEAQLSIQSKDAARAFFAADTGMECALYADRHDDAFNLGLLVYCNETPVAVAGSGPYFFYAPVGVGNDSCVKVTVNKTYNGTQTQITALGYNTTWDGIDCGENTPNPRQVERGYRATY